MSAMPVAIFVVFFLALAQEDDFLNLKPANRTLIGSVVFPTKETASSEDSPHWIIESVYVGIDSEVWSH